MTDVHDKKTRSYNMSKIKGKNTKPELLVRKYLYAKKLRFRLHDPSLPGKPDIVLSKYKVVIEVHGCFWHKHEECKYFVEPKTDTQQWLNKINQTVLRDKENEEKLKQLGWTTFVMWQCELKGNQAIENLESLYRKIICQL